MAQTLLAILFATSSANDQTIAFRWPASPSALARLARQRPPSQLDLSHADAPFRAATYQEGASTSLEAQSQLTGDKLEYEWQRPTIKRHRSQSFASSGRSSSTGRHSPVLQRNDRSMHVDSDIGEYETIFGYHVDLLAHFLCPMKDNCHQKFELIVDDLVFIGHPVCVDECGVWSFKDDKPKEEKNTEDSEEKDGESGTATSADKPSDSLLKLFHVVFVLDLPDPASSASGNLNKYFDTVYQTAAFSLTAVLFNEQVLHGYVENEWELLMKMREDCISNGEPYDCFVSEALKNSSLARTFEQVYKAIHENTLARLTINNISLDLQLPPYLDCLLHPDPLDPSGSAATASMGNAYGQEVEEEDRLDNDYASWGPELSFGWQLPALTPWKALLLLDVDPDDPQHRTDPLQNLNRPGLSPDEREIAEGISRFLDTASVFVTLSDLATLLDWDLHKQVYPTVRYLIQRRRAKVVDPVRSSLKSIFAISPRIDTPIADLSAQFSKEFPTLPPLPVIFSRISGSHNNFFGSVVQSKENIPIYKNVIIWLLKRDLLVMLQMRFRLIATPTLKQWVAATRKSKREARERRVISNNNGHGHVSRGRRRKSSADPFDSGGSRSRSALRSTAVLLERDEEAVEDESGDDELFSPKSQSFSRGNVRHSFLSPSMVNRRFDQWGPGSLIAEQRNRRYSDISPASGHRIRNGLDQEDEEEPEEGDESESESDPDDPEDLKVASLISNPERATRKERRWLRGMADGKSPVVSRRFEKIYRYFDGKTTVDELLYKAEISRKELREVLHQFEEHITTFLHP